MGDRDRHDDGGGVHGPSPRDETASMIAGWYIGGAHLKCAALRPSGPLTGVWEVPCRLREGLDRLEEALAALPTRLGQDTWRHALESWPTAFVTARKARGHW